MATDYDQIFATWVDRLVPLWGPFYALFYILRLMWREFAKKRKE